MVLEYDLVYHLRCELRLNSGRTITLESLYQEMTYAGQLVGRPSAESNDWKIECLLKNTERRCVPPGTKPHLLLPQRRNFLREPGDMKSAIERRPNHIPEWLPMVTCIGSFQDVRTVRDANNDLSVLTVIWFQDEYAMPILEPALSQLRALDWESLATDTSY